MARKFKVLMGTHIQGGKEYKKGDIVTSEEDLATKFVGKFSEETLPALVNEDDSFLAAAAARKMAAAKKKPVEA